MTATKPRPTPSLEEGLAALATRVDDGLLADMASGKYGEEVRLITTAEKVRRAAKPKNDHAA